jgi:hypothetical protein
MKKILLFVFIISVLGFMGYWGIILFQYARGVNNDIIHRKDFFQNNRFIEGIDTNVQTLERRILPPLDFQRMQIDKNTFAEFLRQLPLKPKGSEVKLYNGSNKSNNGVYEAVVDLGIGKKDLHQCADAVMRLRAEYLYQQKRYEDIHFNFTNGFQADYVEWAKGERIVINDNKVSWVQTGKPSNTYQDLWNYLEVIYTYAGTLSLSKELKSVSIENLQAGDVFIQGGSPGHAVIVADVAINNKTGKKIFLLAQSYMPAQEIQILKNPNDQSISPWYSVDFGSILITPEWTFKKTDLKRFAE